MAQPKDIKELRQQLLEAFDQVRQDPRRAIQAKETANLAGKVLGTIKVELEYAMMRGEEPDIPFLGKTSGKPLKNAIKLLDA